MQYAVQWWYPRHGGTCVTRFSDREEAKKCFARMIVRPPIPGDPLSIIMRATVTETVEDLDVVLLTYEAEGIRAQV